MRASAPASPALSGGTPGHSAVLLAAVLLAAALLLWWAPGTAAQESIPLDDFEGWTEWPLYEPGDVELDPDAFESMLGSYEFRTPSGDTAVMRIHTIADVYFQGEPALWVQHTGTGLGDDSTRTSTLDHIIVSRETLRVFFRVAATPGSRSWAGSYDVTQHYPDRVVRTGIGDSARVVQNRFEGENDPFDFATMPYLFSFMELEAGRRFRLMNIGSARDPEPRDVAILVKGRTTLEDAHGEEHEVWDVQLLNHAETLLVHLYVTEEAPRFWGWAFRRVANGATGVEWVYRDHRILPRVEE